MTFHLLDRVFGVELKLLVQRSDWVSGVPKAILNCFDFIKRAVLFLAFIDLALSYQPGFRAW